MDPAPFDLDLQLREHGSALRRLARGMLGEADADDALQETWLRALRQPPRHDSQVGGWLATILRNTIHRRRLSEQRRARREQFAASSELGPDHADTVARAEMAQRLLAIVQQLDAPFRDAIWQRYFEDLPPREIAVREGVPLATVKSRLQRGLQQLRVQLGEGGESDWRSALALAFGFGVEKGAAAGTVAVIAGGVWMAAWWKVVTAAVAAGVVLWWWWPIAAPIAPGASAARTDAVVAHAALAAEQQDLVPTEHALPPDRQRLVPSERAPANPHAVIRGRCIDGDGHPLADCNVRLHAWTKNQEASDLWLRDHESLPQWTDVEHVTGSDGRFELTFTAVPPLCFSAVATCKGRASVDASWTSIATDADIDVGDVALLPGIQLTGLLVDEAGSPQAHTNLSATRRDADRYDDGRFGQWNSPWAKTGADGRFTFRYLFLSGIYSISAQGGDAPIATIELPANQRFVDVRLVLRRAPPQPTISGRVVDANGHPLARAFVRREGTPDSDDTRADGTFALVSRFGGGSARLEVSCDGYESARSPGPIDWGTRDLEFVLQPAPGLLVRITDAEDRLVEDYSLRLLPRDRTVHRGDDERVRARGPFANGTATIDGVASGKYTVMAEFPTETGLLTSFTPIEMNGSSVRLDLRAEQPVTRTLRVVTTTGNAVAGTRVQVCDPVDGPLDERTFVLTAERLRSVYGSTRALVCFDGLTDADGRIAVQGPGSHPVGLLVLGPGHMPVRQSNVRLDVDDELVVTVQRGARLTGRIVPPEAMAEIWRLQGRTPGAALASEGTRPIVTLHRQLGGSNEWLPGQAMDEGQFRVDDVGAFDVSGIPPGQWSVDVRGFRTVGSTSQSTHWDGGFVTLEEGATTSLELDLSALLPGTLVGTVTHNGVPVANGNLRLQCIYGTDGDQPSFEFTTVQTQDTGHFTYVGRPGTYQVALVRMRATPPWFDLTATATATVTRDAITHHTFAIWSGSLKVTLRDATGSPAAAVSLFADRGSDGTRVALPNTDANGVVETDLVPGTWRLSTVPKTLQSPEAQMRLQSETGTDALAEHLLRLTTVDVTSERPAAVELHLPPDWSR